MKTILLSVSLVMGFACASQAATQSLLRLSNDRNDGVAELGLQADGAGAIQKFVYATPQGQKAFTAAQIASGAVLEEEQGVQALILTGQVSSGKLAMKYVYNGLSKEYRSCNMTLSRNTKGEWSLTNAYTGGALRTAKLITWSLGIETIQGLCK